MSQASKFTIMLVSTAEAAKQLGVSERSIRRWTQQGLIAPDMKTPGGHYRWDVDRLREQIRNLPER